MNHSRSKSEDDDEATTSVTSAKRPCIANSIEEQKMDNLISGGKIENLQPNHPELSVISMEDEEFESDNEKVRYLLVVYLLLFTCCC